MTSWLDRYKAGEHSEVWSEMQSLGPDISLPVNRKAADKVVRETMKRAAGNVRVLFSELLSLGYKFQAVPEPDVPDYALELRIEHALAYAAKHGGSKYRSNPLGHPALAWVDDEDIEVPSRFRKGMPSRANFRHPGPRLLAHLHEVESTTGSAFSVAVRGWFELVGSVDMQGSHPRLNPAGTIAALHVSPDRATPLLQIEAGAGFVAAIRHAFTWAGFPGWDGRGSAPERELAWLRSKLQPL